ncbi:histidine kinase [Nocardiopsis quinghaiensis]|uniref:histidine kinase n=1 Tax=Nocardiopsis quinghaiensis TaxID=464995 RepID=UPI001CC2312F|nr:histidine kinase [Nocardiopsis quinghaiensis]
MTDPSSFGTALWTVLIVSAIIVTFGLAVLSDMAMRRREDRAARTTRAGEHRRDSVRRQEPAHQRDSARWQVSPESGNGRNGSAPHA